MKQLIQPDPLLVARAERAVAAHGKAVRDALKAANPWSEGALSQLEDLDHAAIILIAELDHGEPGDGLRSRVLRARWECWRVIDWWTAAQVIGNADPAGGSESPR